MQSAGVRIGFRSRLALSMLSVGLAFGCATVRPEQRAILADPVMRFDRNAKDKQALERALENREGSYGGSSVRGGGCGCN